MKSSHVRILCSFLSGSILTLLLFYAYLDINIDDFYCGWADRVFPKKFIFTVEHRGSMYTGYSHDFMDSVLLGCGGWETGVLNAVEKILSDIQSSAQDNHETVAFDVGAHRGTHTLAYARFVDKVFAFDPHPTIFSELEHNIAQNKINNVTALPIGLGDESGNLEFSIPLSHHTGVGSFAKSPFNSKSTQTINVPIKTGDSIVKEYNLKHVDFIKIDVEGFEKSVIMGLKETFATHRPVVEFEFTPGVNGNFNSIDEIVSTFPENYMFFDLSTENYYSPDFKILKLEKDITEQKDLLLIPEEKLKLFPWISF